MKNLITPICLFLLIIGAGSKKTGFEASEDFIVNPKRMTHICVVVYDLNEVSKAYNEIFGVYVPEITVSAPYERSLTEYNGESTEARVKMTFIKINNTVIELIEPDHHPSTWRDFLDKHGPGVHHIAFYAGQDIEEAIKKLKKRNMNILQHANGYAYMDSKEQLGMVLELLGKSHRIGKPK